MNEINPNDFIADMMRFASSANSPELIINQILEYMCLERKSDRAYIFEDNLDGTYDNTYEYCRPGVTAEIDNLKNVSSEDGIYLWFEEFEKYNNILIYDLEEYKKISEPIYNVLKPQGIQTLVAGPIVVNGKNVGFYGVDNPPREFLEEISELIGVIGFIMDMMLRIRDNMKAIEESSKRDPLTGCGNRKAMEWAYENRFGGASSLSIVMCDLNGLKAKNDLEGHKTGDKYLCEAADVLCECFGKDSVYRVGGDEFVVIKLSETVDSMEKKIRTLREKSKERKVSMSIGFEFRDSFEEGFSHILHDADEKMYAAKAKYYETLEAN